MRGSKFILYWFASYKWNILCYHLQLGRHCAPHQHYQHLCLASFLIRIPPTCCPAPCPAADQPHSSSSGSLWDWSVYTPMPPSMRIVPHNLCSSHCHRTGCRSTVKTNSSQMYIVTSNQTRCTQTMHHAPNHTKQESSVCLRKFKHLPTKPPIGKCCNKTVARDAQITIMNKAKTRCRQLHHYHSHGLW